MHGRIDLLAQDLLGAAHGQLGDVVAQRFAGLHHLLVGLGAGGGDDLGAFVVGTGLGFLDDRLGAAVGVGQALGVLAARGGQFLLDPLVGGGQFALGLVGGSQAFGDLLGALVQRLGDRRPHILHRERHQEQEHDDLDD